MRTFPLCLLLVLLSFVPPAAGAGTEAADQRLLTASELQEIFRELMEDGLPPRVQEITVENFSSRPARIVLPAGELLCRPAGMADASTPGRKTLVVALHVNNEKQGEVTLAGDLHFWGTVVLLARPLARRALLGEQDITTDFRDISMLGEDLITDPQQVIGKKLKKGLRQGALLFAGLLDTPNIVKRGDRVTILSRRAGLEVTVPGEAKDAGAAGEMVRVKNSMSRRVVPARVVAAGLVQVDY